MLLSCALSHSVLRYILRIDLLVLSLLLLYLHNITPWEIQHSSVLLSLPRREDYFTMTSLSLCAILRCSSRLFMDPPSLLSQEIVKRIDVPSDHLVMCTTLSLYSQGTRDVLMDDV